MKRILLLLTVVAVMVAMLVAMAAPAFAAQKGKGPGFGQKVASCEQNAATPEAHKTCAKADLPKTGGPNPMSVLATAALLAGASSIVVGLVVLRRT